MDTYGSVVNRCVAGNFTVELKISVDLCSVKLVLSSLELLDLPN